MAASAIISITGSVTGLPTGTKKLAGQIISTTAISIITDVILASGDNTITVPTGATAVLIQPPLANAIALTLKGAGGDTGILLHKIYPTLVSLSAGQTTLIINAGSLMTLVTEFNFI